MRYNLKRTTWSLRIIWGCCLIQLKIRLCEGVDQTKIGDSYFPLERIPYEALTLLDNQGPIGGDFLKQGMGFPIYCRRRRQLAEDKSKSEPNIQNGERRAEEGEASRNASCPETCRNANGLSTADLQAIIQKLMQERAEGKKVEAGSPKWGSGVWAISSTEKAVGGVAWAAGGGEPTNRTVMKRTNLTSGGEGSGPPRQHEIRIVVEMKKNKTEEALKSEPMKATMAAPTPAVVLAPATTQAAFLIPAALPSFRAPGDVEALRTALLKGLEDALVKMNSSARQLLAPEEEPAIAAAAPEPTEDSPTGFSANLTDPQQVSDVLLEALKAAWANKMFPSESGEEVSNFDIHVQIAKPKGLNRPLPLILGGSPLSAQFVTGGVAYPITITSSKSSSSHKRQDSSPATIKPPTDPRLHRFRLLNFTAGELLPWP